MIPVYRPSRAMQSPVRQGCVGGQVWSRSLRAGTLVHGEFRLLAVRRGLSWQGDPESLALRETMMRDTVACPCCHARLQLPDEPPPGGMTCPRCQARVPHLASQPLQPAPFQAAAPSARIQNEPNQPQSEPAPLSLSRCPACGYRIEPNHFFCPHCGEPLRGERKRNSALWSALTRIGIGIAVGCTVALAVAVLIIVAIIAGVR